MLQLAIGFDSVDRVRDRKDGRMGAPFSLFSVTEIRDGEPVKIFTGLRGECDRFIAIYRAKISDSHGCPIKTQEKRRMRAAKRIRFGPRALSSILDEVEAV